jgi:alkanesulfonate monooxygenase SsuD/methylene tetrahydromethanopterin reductase-like flavin-dependent oxidoreductase (luciferase family)
MHAAGVPFFQDTTVMLARASAVTSRIKLGAGVFLVPLHHPVLFAKQLASIDFYSGGRLIVGAGAGWSRVQCEVMGGNFDRRWAQARETIQIAKRLWTEEVVEFHGEFYDIAPVTLFPKPASKSGPPVLLPGPALYKGDPLDSPASLQSFKRIVAYADGWLPGFVGAKAMEGGPEIVRTGNDILGRLCAEAGRDPRELKVTALLRTEIQDGDLTWPELVGRDVIRRYEDVGVERVIVTIPTLTGAEHATEVLPRMAEALL